MRQSIIRAAAADPLPAHSRGFTLLELLVTLAVVSILMTTAVPSFLDTIRNNRAAANSNELVTALSIARSEAIRRGARIGVCPSTGGTTCDGGGWADGWIVVADTTTGNSATPAGAVLRAWGPPSGNLTLTGPAWVRFLPRGEVRRPTTVDFQLQMAGCSGEQRRRIALNTVGRTSVARETCS